MTERLLYREYRRCPKCGYNVVSTSYRAERCEGEQCVTKDEFMLRTCLQCGYEWKEMPLGE